MASPLKDWDGAAYQRVSDPQFRWGMRVVERAALAGTETVVDVGCGSGRLTAELLERLPRGRVIAVDASPSMLATARQTLARFGDRVEFLAGDALELDLEQAADVVFSTATFHWILDHDKLFRVLYRALRPGGRLVAQCGGVANLAILKGRADELARATRFAPFFRAWQNQLNFATPEETAARLKAAGFAEVETALESAPTPFDSEPAYRQFVATVVLRTYLAAITDEARREEFLTEMVAQAAADFPPFTLDYWRLNLRGRRK
jgi:trans-aconitate 2-methyltransferase